MNTDEYVKSGDSLTFSNLNLKFHTVVVLMLFRFDDDFTVTAIPFVFVASLTYLISSFNIRNTVFRANIAPVLDLRNIIPGIPISSVVSCFFDCKIELVIRCIEGLFLLNFRKLFLYLAQPIDTGADFEPIVNPNPNLNCIYINEDAGFDDDREKDLVMKVLRMLVKTFSKCCPIYFRIWVAGEQIVTRDEMPASFCASSRMKRDTTPKCLVFV